MMLSVYKGVTTLGLPLVRFYLSRRLAKGKENRERFGERLGVSAKPRPEGKLVWVHAASVGESLSLLPLIESLKADRPQWQVLVTTGTVTSAALMADRLPAGAFHQFVPVDRVAYVERFLNHWRPDLALWAESEFWPNLITCSARRGVPMVLINGRVSEKSFRTWRKIPGLSKALMSGFSLCLGQTVTDATRLAELGAPRCKSVGNLKFSAPPLPVNEVALNELSNQIGARPCWLASSTHSGEEEIAGRVQQSLKEHYPDLLTVIVPRHPGRGTEIAEALRKQGLKVALRSTKGLIERETDIYIADTMGELGLFYRLAPVVFIGKSLVPMGGQNPLEAARLDCAIVFGPHMTNFEEITRAFKLKSAVLEISDEKELGQTVGRLLEDTAERTTLAEAAARVAAEQSGVLEAVMLELAPFFEGKP